MKYKSNIFFILTHGENDKFMLKDDQKGTDINSFIAIFVEIIFQKKTPLSKFIYELK